MKLYRTELWAKLAKCKFKLSKVEFLEYVIRRERVLMNLKKIQTVWNWNLPKTVKKLQAFFGFINFYQKFI